jgi:hypothetical protein
MPALRTLLALLVCASLGLGAELRTLTNNLSGQLVSVSAKEVEFSTATGAAKTPLSLVLDITLQRVKPLPATTRRVDVELVDGTQLKCKEDGLVFRGGEGIELSLLSGQKVEVKLKDLAYYVKDAHNPKIQAQWKDILKKQKQKKDKADRLLQYRVIKDDKGKVTDEILFSITGAIGDVDAKGERVEFTPVGERAGKRTLKGIHGMSFYRPDVTTLPTLCLVQDVNGSTLVANKVTLENGVCKLTTTTGVKLDVDQKDLAKLDFNIGKLNFLSDLEPSKTKEQYGGTKFKNAEYHYCRDRYFDYDAGGNALRLGGKTFSKGLWVHTYTELEYNLGEKYKEFSTFLGVDPQMGKDSKVQVTIECDGEKKFSKEITVETKDYITKPLVISVKGVSKLKITVSNDDILDMGGHVTLGNAKVSQ